MKVTLTRTRTHTHTPIQNAIEMEEHQAGTWPLGPMESEEYESFQVETPLWLGDARHQTHKGKEGASHLVSICSSVE